MAFSIMGHIKLIGTLAFALGFVVLMILGVLGVGQHACCLEKKCGNLTLVDAHYFLGQCESKNGTVWSQIDLDIIIGLNDKGELIYMEG
jgi:hypothetical protein